MILLVFILILPNLSLGRRLSLVAFVILNLLQTRHRSGVRSNPQGFDYKAPLSGLGPDQGARHPTSKEGTSHHIGIHSVISGMFGNLRVLGSLGVIQRAFAEI